MSDVIAKSLFIIFERSWRTGKIPEDCRKADVTQTFTKDKEGPKKPMPVSPTTIPGEVIEQLILDAIAKDVVEKKVIRSIQHESTQGKSCLMNVKASYDGMTSWVNEERVVDVVYLDFSKAFDSLP
ncbi:RNA-directed DNA polymerase from mobile element jockey-like protein [Willisornis vidua]|uniref:RNA-directed DNA polymerase from mobile element jockey-like protein n=1 Tax=Willisornis vidua TaxID=1566151 RepID=A0ABQ9DCY3_9PASS|nr:RNA-directed DNA polymerase from mobile element jockey-like protein [Willisornis vidua]